MSYSYRQWENEQNEANNIHADDCYRWQAGIELAGGTWDGEWVDLDKTGKGLVTIDQFNALEQQIQSKVSSYTPKNYDPSSTVQIVPGVDGWNKVEDGILKAVCEPDGVNRNWNYNSRRLEVSAGKLSPAIFTKYEIDENGFGVRTQNGTGTAGGIVFYTPLDATDNPLEGKTIVFSCDIKGSETLQPSWRQVVLDIYGTNDFANFSRTQYLPTLLTSGSYWKFNQGDYVDDEWFRLTAVLTVPPLSEFTAGSSGSFTNFRYAVQTYTSASATAELSVRKPKLEIADSVTDWVDAPEDYGYPDGQSL